MDILCGHALKVMDYMGVTEIPKKHILKRWMKDARDVLPEHLRHYQRDERPDAAPELVRGPALHMHDAFAMDVWPGSSALVFAALVAVVVQPTFFVARHAAPPCPAGEIFVSLPLHWCRLLDDAARPQGRAPPRPKKEKETTQRKVGRLSFQRPRRKTLLPPPPKKKVKEEQ